MQKNRSKRQKAIIKRRIFICSALAVILALLVGIFALTSTIIKVLKKDSSDSESNLQSKTSSEATTKKPYVVSTAKVVNIGDIMVHSTTLDGAKTKDGGYDFSAFFRPVSSYFKDADLAVANLEVTFGGTNYKYSGYPAFNTPDSLADVIKQSGINFLLTSNNHCYDTGLSGLKRTANVLKSKKMSFIGTKETEKDPSYVVKNVNGIKIGITDYTYENTCEAGTKSINGRLISTDAFNLINSFNYDRIDSFYREAEQIIENMKSDGAEAIVFYMHWGEEYQLKQNRMQDAISQKLCNLGVDVIVGGHPHVIQPIKLLHSEDSQNTSVCIYSMGNAISNQRKELMVPECPSGHTEDGMLFYYTFDKYSNGDVVLSGVDIIPAWVNKYKGGSGYQYTMYPLETAESGASVGLDAAASNKAAASFERTKQTIAQGLTECQTALGCKIRFE